jgi:thiol-disulfide isomerase/thioredoxin
MEPGNIQISLKKDEMENIISGTKLNDEWQKLNSAASDYQKEMMRLTEEVQKDTSEQNMQAIMPKVMMAQSKLSDIYYKTAERNIQNELGFFLVSNPVALNEEQVLKLINQMPSKIHARKEIQEIERFLKSSAAQNAEGGSTISDFSAQSPDGKTINAMSVVSKHELTIIDFWASWCSPCMQEMPHMVELYKLYKDKGLGILGVSLDTDEEAWKNAISKTGASWDHISELKRNSEIANMFGVTAIPFTLLVDKEGHVLASGLVGNELEDFVRAQLN